jgi:hypothetical protein
MNYKLNLSNPINIRRNQTFLAAQLIVLIVRQ